MPDWILAFSTVVGAVIYLRAVFALPRLLVGDAVGPQFFPALIGIGLLASGLLLMFETWRKASTIGTAPDEIPEHDAAGQRHVPLVLAVTALWTALYYAAFEPVGYVVATLVYLIPMLCYFHRAKLWVNFACGIGFTALFYTVFARFLGVVLPSGVLAF